MTDINDSIAGDDQRETSRREFLKKAGLAVGAAAALYVVPSITTVKAASAYTSTTGVPCPDMVFNSVTPKLEDLGSGKLRFKFPAILASGCANVRLEVGGVIVDGPYQVNGGETKTLYSNEFGTNDSIVVRFIGENCCNLNDVLAFNNTYGDDDD